jgi:type IV secretion system protein VirD4
MRNYAGHRLSPWLGHLMVSRQETARPLLTPGEVMQLPPGDEIVMVSGLAPMRAHKARYYEDRRLTRRVTAPPTPGRTRPSATDDWSGLHPIGPPPVGPARRRGSTATHDPNGGVRREPDLPEQEEIAPPPRPAPEFEFADDEPDDEPVRAQALQRRMSGLARQASLDPDDGVEL